VHINGWIISIIFNENRKLYRCLRTLAAFESGNSAWCANFLGLSGPRPRFRLLLFILFISLISKESENKVCSLLHFLLYKSARLSFKHVKIICSKSKYYIAANSSIYNSYINWNQKWNITLYKFRKIIMRCKANLLLLLKKKWVQIKIYYTK